MKKYLFLLCLLVIYLILMLTPKTTDVISYQDIKKEGVVTVMIYYENGINSKDLKTLFDDYEGEYYVLKLQVNKEDIMVSCSDFKNCIDEVYSFNNNEFETNYITTGFKINRVYFISYRDEIEKYLNSNQIVYKIL